MVSGGSDGSDRSKRNPHLGGYGVAVALILSVIIAGGVSYSSGIERERRNQYPANYTETAKESALRSCIGAEPGTVFDCVYEKVESSQETARAEQDLDAQQGMKFWALWMFIATVSTVVVTGIGVWYVKKTLETNAKFLKESTKATKQLRKANKIVRKSSERQLRAYLSIDQMGVGDGESHKALNVRLRNFGQTPAKNVEIECATHISIKEPWQFFDQRAPVLEPNEVPPGQVNSRSFYFSEEAINFINGDTPFDRSGISLKAILKIKYTDIFKRNYFTAFVIKSSSDQFWDGQAGIEGQTPEKRIDKKD